MTFMTADLESPHFQGRGDVLGFPEQRIFSRTNPEMMCESFHAETLTKSVKLPNLSMDVDMRFFCNQAEVNKTTEETGRGKRKRASKNYAAMAAGADLEEAPKAKKRYRTWMKKEDTICMFTCCYDDKVEQLLLPCQLLPNRQCLPNIEFS